MSGLKAFSTLVQHAHAGKLDDDEITQRVSRLVTKYPEEVDHYMTFVGRFQKKNDLPKNVLTAIVGPLERTISARSNNDEDEEVTRIASSQQPGDEETVFNPSAGSTATGVVGAEDEATQLNPNPTSTATSATGTGTGTNTRADTTTLSTGPVGGFAGQADKMEVGPGSILKGRFVLENLLGEGGMGVVYKAKDLLKVEARDKNPYVAIKILGEAFQSHPEAFIALQREASKAQRLAHPNIGTVYDFDREGSTIFMTMAMLEGSELKDYIRELPPGGLSFEEAYPIIDGMAQALKYAHDNNLIHSDFKPGNCFFTTDGEIKVIDFGIARASKTQDAEGEATVFDPSQLGALTPAYATMEMFEGQPPHTSDDIYALACTAYELLTGAHPYNKKSAPKAHAAGMKPNPLPPKKLTRRQAKTLQMGVALKREDRIQDIREFINGIKPRKSYTKQIVAGSVLGVALIAGLAYQPIKNYMVAKENEELISRIESEDLQTQATAIEELFNIQESDIRSSIALSAKDAVLGYYQTQVDAKFNLEEQRYEYPHAKRLIGQASTIFPDSAVVNTISEQLDQDVETLDGELRERFERVLKEDRVLSDPNVDDIPEVLTITKKALPESDLLRSPLVQEEYETIGRLSLNQGNLEMAQQVIDTGLGLLPENGPLLELRDSLEREKTIRAKDALAKSLESNIGQLSMSSLSDADGALNDIASLRAIKPKSKVLSKAEKSLLKNFDAEFAVAMQSADANQAESLLLKYAIGLNPKNLEQKRGEVTAKYPANGAYLAQEQEALNQLLAGATNTGEWYGKVRNQMARLTASHPQGSVGLSNEYNQVISTYEKLVNQLADQNRYLGATMAIEDGLNLMPKNERLTSIGVALKEKEAQYRAEQAERARQQRIAELKQSLKNAPQGGSAKQAQSVYDALANELGKDDAYLTGEGKQYLAATYGTAAQNRANQNDYKEAVRLIEKSAKLEPTNTQWGDQASGIPWC